MRSRALLDLYSVILHIFSLTTERLPASNLYNLTKKIYCAIRTPELCGVALTKSVVQTAGKTIWLPERKWFREPFFCKERLGGFLQRGTSY